MTTSILDSLQSMFRSQNVGELSARLGESETAVSRGFESTTATMLGTLGNKATDSSTMRQIFDLVNNPSNDESMLQSAQAPLSGRTMETPSSSSLSGRFLSMLFGGQQSRVAEMIGQSSGLKSSSVSSLMAYAAPLLLGVLGRRVRQDNLDASSFSNMLQGEGAAAKGMIPASIGNILGFGAVRGAASSISETAAPITRRAPAASSRWLWPALAAVLVVAGLVWLFNRGRQMPPMAERGAAVSDEATRARTAGDMFSRQLPTGASITATRGGIEERIITFISDNSKSASDSPWFDFDRLVFDTGSATLRPASQEQLRNIAEIMKSYPNVRAKIGGYTDNRGNPQANLKLSTDRANNVMNSLVSLGVARDRLEAEGYGQEHPIADNSTELGRAQNRRISLRITQK